jgi:hypothetical protein
VDALPRGGPEAAERDASFAADTLGRLTGIGGVDAAFLRDHLEQEIAEAQRIWYRFPVTPYNAMPFSLYREEIFEAAALGTAEDADRYLSLLNDYAAIVEQTGDMMRAQRERGIRLPAWAVPEAIVTMRGHAEACRALVVEPGRCRALAAGPAGRLADATRALVDGRLMGAFLRVLTDLADDERAGGERAGGDCVGIGQYPGGADCYNGLIGLHTGLDLPAEKVHEIGLAELDRINSDLGIADEQAYRASLAGDPDVYARSPADVERIFRAHIDRIMPELPRCFSRLPAARDPALRGRRPRPGARLPPGRTVPARTARQRRYARVPRRRARQRPAAAARPWRLARSAVTSLTFADLPRYDGHRGVHQPHQPVPWRADRALLSHAGFCA